MVRMNPICMGPQTRSRSSRPAWSRAEARACREDGFRHTVGQAVGLTNLAGQPANIVDRQHQNRRDDLDRPGRGSDLYCRQQGLGVRQIIDEMMFRDAQRVEAEVFGKLALLDRIPVHLLRRVAKVGPVTRQIETKAHRHLLSTRESCQIVHHQESEQTGPVWSSLPKVIASSL